MPARAVLYQEPVLLHNLGRDERLFTFAIS
jgi:hypothetical protein